MEAQILESVDKNNKDIVYELIGKYFSLSKISLERIKNQIYRESFPEIYQHIFDSKFQRKYYTIPDEIRENVDGGWKLFQKIFSNYVKVNNITYVNFVNNMLERDNQKVRLFKDVGNFYKEEETFMAQFEKETKNITERKKFITSKCDEVSNLSLPKNKKISLVFSRNMADWFLCSTANSWSSCIDMKNNKNEGMFWAGVPGLFIDENRVMVYITDGTKKNYRGIIVDKAISRAFFVMNENDVLCEVKWYPSCIISNEEINKFIPNKLGKPDELTRSKFPVDFAKHSNGKSCYPYQDSSTFEKIGDKFYLVGGDSGVMLVDGNGIVQEDFVFSENAGMSLDDIIETGNSLSDYFQENFVYCPKCHYAYPRVEMVKKKGEFYCPECYDKLFEKVV